ncbi:DUF551 domain-containing protein [Raoultella ornithinolytica]
MTSKLTITDDKLSALLSEMERSFTGCQGHGYIDAAEEYTDMISALRELQERRKAEKDSEPVAWTDEEELRDVNVAGIGYLFGIDQEANKFADPRRQIMLYRHAQPAPVVTFYRDGIEAAAKWIDQQREAYDSEHGWSDPGTGSFEFGNDDQREYSSTLEELAEGIRSLHPNAGNSPVIPDGYVIVPKEPTQAMCAAFNDSDYGRKSLRERYVAMLAAAAHDTPALNSVQSVATVPGKWVPVSERMPETDGNYWGWWSESKRQGPVWFIKSELQAQFQSHEITHWMPLPADPQEVSNEK